MKIAMIGFLKNFTIILFVVAVLKVSVHYSAAAPTDFSNTVFHFNQEDALSLEKYADDAVALLRHLDTYHRYYLKVQEDTEESLLEDLEETSLEDLEETQVPEDNVLSHVYSSIATMSFRNGQSVNTDIIRNTMSSKFEETRETHLRTIAAAMGEEGVLYEAAITTGTDTPMTSTDTTTDTPMTSTDTTSHTTSNDSLALEQLVLAHLKTNLVLEMIDHALQFLEEENTIPSKVSWTVRHLNPKYKLFIRRIQSIRHQLKHVFNTQWNQHFAVHDHSTSVYLAAASKIMSIMNGDDPDSDA
jgi:hypothetical protein